MITCCCYKYRNWEIESKDSTEDKEHVGIVNFGEELSLTEDMNSLTHIQGCQLEELKVKYQ